MNTLLGFHQTGDPLTSLGLGVKAEIEHWLKEMGIKRYMINKDLSIDIFGDLNITNKNLKNLPSFIKFNVIRGGFYGNGNHWTNLDGMPEEVYGDFELHAPWIINESEEKISEEMVRDRIQIHGKMWL